MEQPQNKPRVFLSHSKKNSEFIERLASDLRKCHIDPWLDTYEIRHGKSWLDSIFQYGLPTCDAILVYFTEASLDSAVVKKEMDAGILQTLGDNNIAFLPYVNNAKLRAALRPDIQALQTPEWNESNYHTLLPIVVAEIWRSFLERVVASATTNERLKSAKLQLELEKSKNESFFTAAENSEFDFIWKSFDRFIPLAVKRMEKIQISTEEVEDEVLLPHSYPITLNVSPLFACLSNYVQNEFEWRYVAVAVLREAKLFLDPFVEASDDGHNVTYSLEGLPDLTKELRMYELIEKVTVPTNNYSTVSGLGASSVRYVNVFSKKYFRYRYWLAYNKKLPSSLQFERDNGSQ